MDGRAGWMRHQRKQQVINILLFAAFEKTEQFRAGWYSTLEIAKLMGLRPTGYLRGILNELLHERCLDCFFGKAKNGSIKHFWQLQEIARWTEPYKSVIDAMLEDVEDSDHA